MRRLLSILALFALPCAAELPDFYKRVDRVVWIVEDLDDAVAGWDKLGVEARVNGMTYGEPEFRGTETDSEYKWAVADFGNVTVDFIQPAEGDDAYAEFAKKHGSGIMALLHQVPNAEAFMAEIRRMRELGVGVLQHDAVRDTESGKEIQYALFDTEAGGKYVVGLYYTGPTGPPTAFLPPPAKTKARRITQFAFAVRDLDGPSKYWARLAWPEISVTHPALTDLKYHGRPGQFDSKLGWQRQGPIVYEWVLPLKGPNIYEDHLAKHGEGIQHIAFNVPDMKAAETEFVSAGFTGTQSGGWGEAGKPGSGRFSYFDTHAIGGTDVELLWDFPK
jgi:methylmalonyl-CoA/ethylmalonyl-CoA epimerase